jgi:O-antigen/teichoic acid export membrane protein
MYNLFQIIPQLFMLLGIGVCWFAGKVTVLSVASTLLGGFLLAVLIRVCLTARKILETKIEPNEYSTLLKRGVAFHLPQILGTFSDRIDMFLVIHFLSHKEVGFYQAATTLAWSQYAATWALKDVGFAKVSGEGDRAIAVDALLRQFHAAQAIVLVLVTGLVVMCQPIIRLAYGAPYTPAASAAVWLIPGLGLLCLVRVIDNGMRGLGRAWPSSIAYICGLLVIVIGGWSRLPEGGIRGMSIVFLSAQMVSLVTMIGILVVSEKVRVSRLILSPNWLYHRIRASFSK